MIPAKQYHSDPVDLWPSLELLASGSKDKWQFLVPIETAPEVLAVNSDFDEGRIDEATGYAIPDCDDIAGVDQKTGSGNTSMALEAHRAHLDGVFAQTERITDDMHPGWLASALTNCMMIFGMGRPLQSEKLINSSSS